MNKKLYCIVGLPLSGKSHMSRLLRGHISESTLISSGDIARALIASQAEQAAMERHDLYQGEDALRAALKNRIENSKSKYIFLEGFPRTDDQVEWLFKEFNHYFPQFIEARVADEVTLFTRAEARARDANDSDINKFRTRLGLAKQNLSSVRQALTDNLHLIYTILTESDDAIIKQFEKIQEKI